MREEKSMMDMIEIIEHKTDEEKKTTLGEASPTVSDEEKKAAPIEESTTVTGEETNTTPPSRRKYKQESKDRRFSLLLTPTLYMRVQRRARKEHLSMNEFINRVLDKHFLS